MKQETKQERSAGGVVYRKTGDTLEFLIGKHSGYHKWVLPKGMVEKGETLEETALREVFEEVGVRAKIVDMAPLKTIEYFYFADLGEIANKNPHTEDTTRRVIKYQEEGGGKVRIHKSVTYYLMEVESDEQSHGWEMSERKWLSYEDALKTLEFESEREVLQVAGKTLNCAPAEI